MDSQHNGKWKKAGSDIYVNKINLCVYRIEEEENN